MGNVLMAVQDFGRTLTRCTGVQNNWSNLEVDQEALLLTELMRLKEVELWRLHWCLSQDLLQDFPPIPPRWLRSANAFNTAKTMLSCYNEQGALKMLSTALTLMGQDDLVCQPHLHTDSPRPRQAPKPDPDFVKTQRRKLISRIQCLDHILDDLQADGILNTTNRDAINIYGILKEKNHALVDLILKKGDRAQEKFYKALNQSEPFLLQELEYRPIMVKNPTEMLEFLVSDELRSFQWLVSDQVTGESSPPFGEQLQNADRPMTQRFLGKHFGPKQLEDITKNILLKIVPTLSDCLPGEAVTSENSHDITVETNMDTTVVEMTPEVFEDGFMFRLHCQQPGVFRCSQTGLILEGVGDVVYQTVPWDVGFLSYKGLRPAGPLFRFTLLTGSFHRLHLPHCQLLSDGGQHFLCVAHVSGDSVDFITPGQVTEGHVMVDVSGFSCFGLVTAAADDGAISSLVLLFREPSSHSLFVLLLPRNVCLPQVMKELKQRIRAEYVETVPDCELIPNQTYRLSGLPVTVIQPETSKFINFSDYHNFLPSFQVQLAADVSTVELQLKSHVTPMRLIGWLFGPTESVVWHRVVQMRAAASTFSTEVCVSESVEETLLLLKVLDSLRSEDMKVFQHLLSLQSDPIPISRLEAADRTRTVDLMVQRYHSEGAKQVTEEILRTMNYKQLADQLQRS